MPRTGVWRAGSLLLAALLTGCGESEIAEPGTQDGGARDTTTISADAVARLRQGLFEGGCRITLRVRRDGLSLHVRRAQ